MPVSRETRSPLPFRHSDAPPAARPDAESELLRLLARNPPRNTLSASPQGIDDDPARDFDEISLQIDLDARVRQAPRIAPGDAPRASRGYGDSSGRDEMEEELDLNFGYEPIDYASLLAPDPDDDDDEDGLDGRDDPFEAMRLAARVASPSRASQHGLLADEDLRALLRLGGVGDRSGLGAGNGGAGLRFSGGPGDGSHSLADYWPGLLGTHPLNGPSPLRQSSASPSTSPPASISFTHPAFTPHLSRSDPPSSTSPLSFLQPGSVLTGQQIFQKRARTSAPPARPQPAFVSPPPLFDLLPGPPRTSASSRTPLDDYRSAQARLRVEETIAAANARHPVPHPPEVDISPSARRRSATDVMRARIARLSREGGESGMSAYEFLTQEDARAGERDGEEEEEGVTVTLEDLRSASRAALYGNGRAAESTMWGREEIAETPREGLSSDEHWAVRVVIHTYEPSLRSLTGTMAALGVPDSLTQVTTFFKGEILDPDLDGLFTRKWGARRRDDVDFWSRLGPFKGISRDELKARAGDPVWLRERSEGWVLMRWKEADFVNVTPETSSLSISGFYLVAMQRSSGALEGLYCDHHGHAATSHGSPYQRLILSAATPRAPFSIGSFGVR